MKNGFLPLLLFCGLLFFDCLVSDNARWPLFENWPFDCVRSLESPRVGVNLDSWRFIISAGEVYSFEDFSVMFHEARTAAGADLVRIHLNGGAFEPAVGQYNKNAFRQDLCRESRHCRLGADQ